MEELGKLKEAIARMEGALARDSRAPLPGTSMTAPDEEETGRYLLTGYGRERVRKNLGG
jgi:hypothetical protein